MADLTGAVWRKSTRSDAGTSCVEVAKNLPGVVGVRDSKDRSGPVLTFDPESRRRARRAIAVAWRVAAVFLAGAAPLLWQAAWLIARGEYVTQEYGWRSVPHGVDLLRGVRHGPGRLARRTAGHHPLGLRPGTAGTVSDDQGRA